MKKITFLIISLVLAFLSYSQQISRSVVSNGGNFSFSGGFMISSTIGEIAVSTLTSGSNILTQGFQQPENNTFDCNGIANGLAMVDDCGVCQSALVYNYFTHVATPITDTSGYVFGPTEMLVLPNDPMNPYWNSSCSGCTDSSAFNFDPSATIDDSSCVPFIYGCTDPTAANYDSLANTDDGTCHLCFDNYLILIMTDSYGDGWNGNVWNLYDQSGAVVSTSGLISGYSGTEILCIPDGCYTWDCDGGNYQGEVGWTLTDDFGTVLATG